MSDPVSPPAAPPQGPTRRELVEQVESLRARVAELEAALASAQAVAAPAVVAEDAWVLLTPLRHNGRLLTRGDVVPFDPVNAPKGCDGLVEGVHYERGRILVRG